MSKWSKKKHTEAGHRDPAYETDGSDPDETEFETKEPIKISARICLWEFGQNDPKRFALVYICVIDFFVYLKPRYPVLSQFQRQWFENV